jgi:hypothetical protein
MGILGYSHPLKMADRNENVKKRMKDFRTHCKKTLKGRYVIEKMDRFVCFEHRKEGQGRKEGSSLHGIGIVK